MVRGHCAGPRQGLFIYLDRDCEGVKHSRILYPTCQRHLKTWKEMAELASLLLLA